MVPGARTDDGSHLRPAGRRRQSDHRRPDWCNALDRYRVDRPDSLLFDGSEADFLRYLRLAAAGARPSSRDVQNPVSVKLADETDYVHQGQMDFVDNVLNPKTGTIRGRAVFENKNGLLTPGFFGRLRLFGGEH